MKYRKLNEVLIEWNESSKQDSDNVFLKSEDIKESLKEMPLYNLGDKNEALQMLKEIQDVSVYFQDWDWPEGSFIEDDKYYPFKQQFGGEIESDFEIEIPLPENYSPKYSGAFQILYKYLGPTTTLQCIISNDTIRPYFNFINNKAHKSKYNYKDSLSGIWILFTAYHLYIPDYELNDNTDYNYLFKSNNYKLLSTSHTQPYHLSKKIFYYLFQSPSKKMLVLLKYNQQLNIYDIFFIGWNYNMP